MSEKYQKIVITGLLIREGKVLAIRRSMNENFLPGKYEFPGGKVDFGEIPEKSLKREFKEEVNLDIEVIKPLATTGYISDNGNRHSVEIFYQVSSHDSEDKIKLSPDHDDFKWVEIERFEETVQGFPEDAVKKMKDGLLN